MPILAYFDQTHIARFSDAQVERLAGLVAAGKIFAPVSMIHYVETLKRAQAVRHETIDRLDRLSGGLGLPHEGEIALLEWSAFRGLDQCVFERLRSKDTWNHFAAASTAGAISAFGQVPDELMAEVRGEMDATLNQAAADHEKNRRKPVLEVLESLAQALELLSGGSTLTSSAWTRP